MAGMRRTAAALGFLAVLALAAGCRRAEPAGPRAGTAAERKATELLLAAYTTPREAYRDAIIPAFQAGWKSKTGGAVEFKTSYQGSGAQARAIIGGFEADVAADPFTVYRALRHVNPSPYMYFIRMGEVAVVGSSPEMLVRVEGARPSRSGPTSTAS